MDLNKFTSVISLFVFVLFISASVLYFVHKDDNKENALICASFYGADIGFDNEKYYWKENGVCCHYDLIDNKITEVCNGTN